MAKVGVVAIGCGAVVLVGVAALVVTGAMLFVTTAPPGDHDFEPEISSPQVTFPDGPPDIEAPSEAETEGDGEEHAGNDSKEGAGKTGSAGNSELKFPDIPVAKRGNRANGSFYKSKRILGDIHRDGRHEKTFYCDCDFRKKDPVLKSCGYRIKHSRERAERIEYEHVVPASRFGRTFKEWTEGHPSCPGKGRGRDCAEDRSEAYQLMQADLYNLQPAIGEVNGDRSNYEMAILDGEAREYGKCDVEIRDRKIEPSERIRGDIARTYLYMDWAYPGRVNLSKKERAMFMQWHRADPPDRWEIERARRIEKIQGNRNPLLSGPGR
jgi:deoxyribonuclease-1